MKTTLQTILRWSSSLLLAIIFLASIWACDFDFGVTISGKDVNVTSVSGAAKNIEAKIKVAGKKCDFERTITGTIGADGCLTIKGTICGVDINETICGFQPNAPFCYNLKVSGGGMVAIEVPLSYAIVDSGMYMSADGTDSAKVMLSDTPFGYALLHPLIPEPGKKVIFAKWEQGYDDHHIDGIVTTRFRSMRSGLDSVKFILLGEIRLLIPGTPTPLPFLRDSVYLFAEYPMIYDFGSLSAPSFIPVHSVGGSWQLLGESDASVVGLPDTKGSTYIRFTPEGANISDLANDYSFSAGSKEAKGVYYSSVGGIKPAVYVKFSRADIMDVTDSMRRRMAIVFKGSIITASFPTTFAVTDTIHSLMHAASFSEYVTSLSISPNPTYGRAVIAYTVRSMATVKIALLDEKGVVLHILANRIENAGAHEVALDDLQLPSGTYMLKFNVISQVDHSVHEEMRKIVIIR